MGLVKSNKVLSVTDDDGNITYYTNALSSGGTSDAEKRLRHLKTWVWAYFLLLIFEGALRKWFLPGLSTPLLIVRDPIAIYLLLQSMRYGIFKPGVYIYALWILTSIAFLTTLIFGHGDPTVAIFGARIFLLHFPLMFVISCVFDHDRDWETIS